MSEELKITAETGNLKSRYAETTRKSTANVETLEINVREVTTRFMAKDDEGKWKTVNADTPEAIEKVRVTEVDGTMHWMWKNENSFPPALIARKFRASYPKGRKAILSIGESTDGQYVNAFKLEWEEETTLEQAVGLGAMNLIV